MYSVPAQPVQRSPPDRSASDRPPPRGAVCRTHSSSSAAPGARCTAAPALSEIPPRWLLETLSAHPRRLRRYPAPLGYAGQSTLVARTLLLHWLTSTTPALLCSLPDSLR